MFPPKTNEYLGVIVDMIFKDIFDEIKLNDKYHLSKGYIHRISLGRIKKRMKKSLNQDLFKQARERK